MKSVLTDPARIMPGDWIVFDDGQPRQVDAVESDEDGRSYSFWEGGVLGRHVMLVVGWDEDVRKVVAW